MKNLIPIPIISFIGFSKSGKTASLENLISFCHHKGHQVIALKHTGCKDFTIDTKGKNTWKYAQAGALLIASHSKEESALILKEKFDEATLVEFISYNLQFPQLKDKMPNPVILCEGFRDIAVPKILCVSDESDLDDQYNNEIVAISGKISNNRRKAVEISSKYEISVINTLENPEKLYSILIDPNSSKKI